jgi:hypothetical protein
VHGSFTQFCNYGCQRCFCKCIFIIFTSIGPFLLIHQYF